MDPFYVLVGVAILGLGFLVYVLVFKKPKGWKVYVNYSEKVGDLIIEHSKTYEGYCQNDKDLMVIKDLGLERPIPPREVLVPTNTGTKKLNLLRIDNDRYAFRVPQLDNKVFTYKKDKNGKIVYNEVGKPILIKHNWQLCDDVIEQDVKHWADMMHDEVKKVHDVKVDMLTKWAGPLAMGLIFLFAIIALQMTSKQMIVDKESIMMMADKTQEDAARTQENLNALLEKVTGQRTLENEQEERDNYQDTG